MIAGAEGARAITPIAGPIAACPRLPGSKSLTNRALVVAALGDGPSELRGALESDDTKHMVESLRRLGFAIAWDRERETISVEGKAGTIPSPGADLFGGNAGTAVRFLTAFVSLGQGTFRIDGDPRMRERPIQDQLDAMTALGVRVRSELGTGCPPIVVDANGLPGGPTQIAGSTSSQFTSAILLAAPFARADVELTLTGTLVGAPFVDMTIALMASRGVACARSGSEIRVRAGQRYGHGPIAIEPDATAASYFMAAAALLGGEVEIRALGRSSLQGDIGYARVLAEMGAEVEETATGVRVRGRELRGGDFDFRPISDTFLTAAAIAPFASSPTRIRGIGHTRKQETDRVTAVATELRKLGVEVEESEDALEIRPSVPRAGSVATYHDHRMAMSFALIGLKVPGIRILDPACVDKTFPRFFDELERLRPPGSSA